MKDLQEWIYAIDEMREKHKDIHPLFQEKYVICIIKDNKGYIYDESLKIKDFIEVITFPINVPNHISACFPLDVYNHMFACIMGVNDIGKNQWFVNLFHEMVHCYQGKTIEGNIKKRLTLCDREDPRWEINYPFPYNDLNIIHNFKRYKNSLDNNDSFYLVHEKRNALLTLLKEEQQEYMIWQEWKEGFARYCENTFRIKLGMGKHEPSKRLNRMSFYDTGAMYIEKLIDKNMDMATELELLYEKMASHD